MCDGSTLSSETYTHEQHLHAVRDRVAVLDAVSMPTLSGSLKPLGAASPGIQDPGLHNTKNSSAERDLAVTASEYGTLQNAYDYFNRALFGGGLPQVLITLQRRAHALGYFSPDRFQHRGETDEQVHEIALNPNGFAGKTDEEILSTLVHEMVHVWQQEYGHPGRGRYHNREWAHKMYGIGLVPSSTGKPGGAITGDSMSHYALEDGPYLTACREFLKCCRLVWESAADADHDSGAEDETTGVTKPQTRAKFTCPNCGLNVWAKPSALVDCHSCSAEAGEHIPLLPDSTRQPETEGSRDGKFGKDEQLHGAGLNTVRVNPEPDDDTEGGYSRVIDLMTQATQSASQSGISLEEFLPALVDFTSAVALMIGGEECLRAFITRMEHRDLDDLTRAVTSEEIAETGVRPERLFS